MFKAVAARPRSLLHLANLLVIAFFLLPLVAVLIGSAAVGEERCTPTRAGVLPPEWHARQLPGDPDPGRAEGPQVFEQATYLPDNIKKFYRA